MVGRGITPEPLHQWEDGTDRRLAARVVDPSDDTADREAPVYGGIGDLGIEPSGQCDRITDAGSEDAGGGLAEEKSERISGLEVAALEDLVDALRFGLDAIAEKGDQ